MRAVLVLPVILGLGTPCVPAVAAPERKVVAMEYVKMDLKALADQVASAARRCWLTRGPAFEAFRFERVEKGATPDAYRLVFSDKTKAKTLLPRHLAMAVESSGAATLIAVEQDGIDFREAIGRDAESLIKGRVVTC
jgi:hypothetical protein